MTYATEKDISGRTPFARVTLQMSDCANTYGNSPCTASGGAGSECYNTYSTCQDTPNYVAGTESIWIETQSPWPSITPFNEKTFPCIVGFPKVTSTSMNIDTGISIRGSLEVVVRDFVSHDRGIDPYESTRAAPEGTFFGRFLARNKHYQDRQMLLFAGYMDNIGQEHLRQENYVISSIEGPFIKNGEITYKIIGKDPLNFTRRGRSYVNFQTYWRLNASINATATSLVINGSIPSGTPTGVGTVAIGDEIIVYTSRTGNTLNGLGRGSFGSTAAAHAGGANGDPILLCQKFSTSPVNMIWWILTTRCKIPSSYIDYNGVPGSGTGTWDVQEDTYFAAYPTNSNPILKEPIPAIDAINQICELFQLNVWWSTLDQKIRIQCSASTLETQYDVNDTNMLENSFSVKEMPEKRISRVQVTYDKLDWGGDDRFVNYQRHYFANDTTTESANAYNNEKSKHIKSIWAEGTADGYIGTASGSAKRLLDRFKETPKLIKFRVDARMSDIDIGDFVQITTRHLQGPDGAALTVKCRVIKRTEVVFGHTFEYEVMDLNY